MCIRDSVKPGQHIQVKAKSQTMVPFQAAAEGVHRDVLPAVPGYLDVNLPSLKATLTLSLIHIWLRLQTACPLRAHTNH